MTIEASQKTIEIRRQFDPALWNSVSRPDRPATTFLVTWTAKPEPIDGGMPLVIQLPFSQAILHLGQVFFAAEADARAGERIASIHLTRGAFSRTGVVQSVLNRFLKNRPDALRWILGERKTWIFRSKSPDTLRAAFESGLHNWSLNAQWLIVANPSLFKEPFFEPPVRSLYNDWTLPIPWPEGVLVFIQAAVDGDGAICYCRDQNIEETLIAALKKAILDHGGQFREDDGSGSKKP